MIGANLIISKINEKSDKKVSLKLDKEGWNAGVTDGKKGDYKIKFGHDMHGYSAKVVDKVAIIQCLTEALIPFILPIVFLTFVWHLTINTSFII
jgi:hypothetical protein